MERGLFQVRSAAGPQSGFDVIEWASPAMHALERELGCARRCELNVLISGEKGVGKRAVAMRVYREGRRASRSLLVASGSGSSDSGQSLAVTLAQVQPDATILLEHPQRLPPTLQAQLLEFIEQGGNRDDAVRFLTVAPDDLFQRVEARAFCDSLFYRLNPIHLIIPPLRERCEDVPLLLEYFLALYARDSVPRLSVEAREHLMAYDWPGNIEELESTARQLASKNLGLLEAGDLPANLTQA